MDTNARYSFEELGSRELMKGDVGWWCGLIVVVATAIAAYVETSPY